MKTIPNYEGLYSITKDGKVWSHNVNRFMKTQIRTITKDRIKPYKTELVKLCKNGKYKGFTIHRLLALTYINNPNNYNQLNHKDGNSLNNTVDNLEWCTAKQNMQHAKENGLMTQYTEKQIKTRKLNGAKTIKENSKHRKCFQGV